MSFTHLRVLAFGLPALLLVGACDTKEKDKDISEPPQRDGSQLQAISGKYSDDSPSLSADGTKVVFLSGRDSSAEKPALKAYKADWAAGSAPGTVARVTAKDIGSETAVQISPNGAWVLLQASGGAAPGIYLQDYAGAAEPVRITDGTAAASHLAFSPDSKLAAWIERSPRTSKVVLLDLGDGTDLADAAKRQDGSPAGDFVDDLAFSPDAPVGSYTLVTGVKSSGQVSYFKRTFTRIADAAAVVHADWTTGIVPTRASGIAISAIKGIAPTKLLPAGKKTAVRAGDFEEEEAKKAKSAVLSEPVFIDVAAGEQKTFATLFGYDVLSVDAFSDGTGLVTSRSAFRCKDPDDGVIYGSGMVIAPADASSFSRIIPQLTEDRKGFIAVDDFCKRTTAGGKLTFNDIAIDSARLASGSTPQKFRMAYVSRSSTALDSRCFLKLGDTEVYLLDVDGDTKTIHALSKNPADIKTERECAS